jgi:transposase
MDDASALAELPDDPVILKQMIAARTREIDQRTRECDDLRQQTEGLKQRIDELQILRLRIEMELLRYKKWYYGPKADDLKHYADSAQLLLEFAGQWEARPVNPQDLPSSEPLAEGEVKTVRRVRRGRRNLAAFENLPVTRKEYDLAEDQKPCPCCGGMRERIGQESSWQVEYIPGHFERIEHVRLKYACKHCEQNALNPNIELADKPGQPIDKGMAGPGLLAYVVTSKYADYLPLYRLEGIFERNGLEISRATQGVWCGDVADLLKPLYDLMVRRVLESHVVCTDDTVMPMQWPGKTKRARMWVYVGDEHHPYNVFDFTLGRSRDGPATFLKDFKQTLLGDAYGGYDGIVVGNDIRRAGCWAHARRKFVDAEKAHPAIAQEAVAIIKRLYAIEEQARKSDEDRRGGFAYRLCLRQSQSQSILRHLRDRLWTWKDQLLPKHPMAEAVNYALNQWDELNVFASDGAVPIDNNVSEREMKRVVLNRKNSLFVGNERGGRTAAILSSLTSTCKRHGIDPQHYLTQLLTNLPATPVSEIARWLPDEWKSRNPSPSG